MKKRIFFYIIVLFSNMLFAAEKKAAEKKDYLSMRITPEIALMNGFVKEYVFNDFCKNKDNVESRLDWDVKNIAVFKIRGDFDILDYIYTGIDFSIAIPGKSGKMQDYDWLNSLGGSDGTRSDWLNDPADENTDYSCHTNNLEKYMSFSFALGGNIQLPYEIKLSPFISYDYDYIGFYASDGYGIYKDLEGGQIDYYGKVISYKQESNAFSLGIKFQSTAVPHTWLYSDFSVSPALTFTNAMDYHYEYGNPKNATAYWDKFSYLWQLKTNMKAQYIFNENHSAGLAGFIQYVPRQKGRTYQKEFVNGKLAKGTWTELIVKGGLERLLWSVSLSYSFSL